MDKIIKLKRINTKIDKQDDISEIRQLSNLKKHIIYAIIDQIMIRNQFPLSNKIKLEALKYEVEQISIILQERAYFDSYKMEKGKKEINIPEIIRNLSKRKSELQNQIFKLNPSND